MKRSSKLELGLPSAASKHTFVPQYVCTRGVVSCSFAKSLSMDFSTAYKTMNVINNTAKIEVTTSKTLNLVKCLNLYFMSTASSSSNSVSFSRIFSHVVQRHNVF